MIKNEEFLQLRVSYIEIGKMVQNMVTDNTMEY